MFGIIYGIVALFGAGYETARRSMANRDGKERARQRIAEGQNPYGVYYDWQGNCRNLYTDELVEITRENNRLLIKDADGKVIRDITGEQITREVRRNKKETDEGKAIEEYSPAQMRRLWGEKFYGYHPKKYDFQLCDFGTYIYIHCFTGRRCVKTLQCDHNEASGELQYYARVSRDIEKIAKEMFGVPKKIMETTRPNTIHFGAPFLYLDLMTGEILGIDRESGHKFTFYCHAMFDPEFNNGIVERCVDFSEEEGKKIIAEYNRRIRKGEIQPYLTGWQQLFE